MMRALCLAAALLCRLSAAAAEDALRLDFNDVNGWEPQPGWLSDPSTEAKATAAGGIAEFRVPEPWRGLKWSLTLEDPVDLESAPWLVVRYRAVNYRPTVDYLLWLRDGSHADGVPLLVGDRVKADGQWHTQAVHLPEAGVSAPVSAIALQSAALERGDASLFVDFIAITDTPPADAEGYVADRAPQTQWPVDLASPTNWVTRPSWLDNHSPTCSASRSASGLIFKVPEGMRGAKWSCQPPQPICGASWVAMRYRARNLQAYGDYALYVASEGGGEASREQDAIRQTDVISDGEWHVAIGRVTVPSIRTLAVQVQALRADASLEIGDLRFLDGKPVITLSDTFESAPGWPGDMAHWRGVALPPGNLTGEDLARRLGVQGGLDAGKVTAGGVPFLIRGGTDAVMMTPLKPAGSVEAPLSGKAAEAYLLLAAQFPKAEEPSYPGGGGLVREVHRLVARIDYADGTAEEQFPFAASAGQHAISRGLRLYSLALDPGKALTKLTLLDQMERGAFGLAALTLSDLPGPATAPTAPQPAVQLPGEKPVAARAAGIRREGSMLAIDALTISLALDLGKGLRVASLTNHSGVGLGCRFSPGPLFRVSGAGFEVNSEQFQVDQIDAEQGGYRIDLSYEQAQPALRVSVWVDVSEPREVGLRAKIDLGGRDPVATRLIFPELRGVGFGADDDLWVWTPRRGDVITRETVSLRESYAGAGNPLQIIGAFDPRQGTGLYLMTEDRDAVARYYHVQKSPEGARLGVEYTPLRDGLLPRAILGFNQGDWHAQLARYQEWARTWYAPAAPRKPWFRQVFSFRQQFLHYGLPTPSGMFDRQTKTFRLSEALAKDEEAFGGLDYLHLFDWGWDPAHGRCGDYQPWDYLGGADSFRRAVAGVQDAGTPVGLYIEGILMEPTSDIGKAHGAEWQMLDAQLKPYPHFAPSLNMCSWVTPWQDYLSDTYQRVQRESGARGFYIDEYGFEDYGRSCYSPAHGHPVPSAPTGGERQMLRKVRQKLGPEAALYTEESPTDVNSQYLDGSFTYNISSVTDAWSPTHVNLYRFALPTFKTIEIITCDKPLGSNVEAVKRILFNGEAIWLEGNWDKWFSKAVREQIALNRRVMRESRQCFAGDHVEALAPTLLQGVYANRFSERPDLVGKTCWTIYNTTYRTLRGEAIAVDHAPGAQYLDEITGLPLPVRVAGKRAYVTLSLAPRDVAVISRGLFLK